jgi:ABC-2 type transport system permease protein
MNQPDAGKSKTVKDVNQPRTLGVLVEREFNNRARKKGFWVFTFVGLLLLIGLTFLPNIMHSLSSAGNPKILFNDPEKLIAPSVNQIVEAHPDAYNFRITSDTTIGVGSYTHAQMTNYLKTHHTRLAVVVSGTSPATATFTFEQQGTVNPATLSSLQGIIRQQVMNARVQQVSVADNQILSAPVTFTMHQLETGTKSIDQLLQSEMLVYVMMILLFATMAVYGAWVAQGIVEEKSNRIIEMMLVTSRPWEIMTGKIVGIGLVGLLQYVIWMAGAALSLAVQKQAAVISLSAVPVSTFIILPVFFILGYFLYATLYAVAGSLVYRAEDQQMAVTPVAMVLLILFYVALFGVIPNPNSTFAVIVSYIPLFTPLTMFARAALASVPVWEVLISVLITIAFNAVLIVYGAKVYRRFALRTSGKSGWRLLWQKEFNPSKQTIK